MKVAASPGTGVGSPAATHGAEHAIHPLRLEDDGPRPRGPQALSRHGRREAAHAGLDEGVGEAGLTPGLLQRLLGQQPCMTNAGTSQPPSADVSATSHQPFAAASRAQR
jgi:hypothetical protein